MSRFWEQALPHDLKPYVPGRETSPRIGGRSGSSSTPMKVRWSSSAAGLVRARRTDMLRCIRTRRGRRCGRPASYQQVAPNRCSSATARIAKRCWRMHSPVLKHDAPLLFQISPQLLPGLCRLSACMNRVPLDPPCRSAWPYIATRRRRSYPQSECGRDGVALSNGRGFATLLEATSRRSRCHRTEAYVDFRAETLLRCRLHPNCWSSNHVEVRGHAGRTAPSGTDRRRRPDRGN